MTARRSTLYLPLKRLGDVLAGLLGVGLLLVLGPPIALWIRLRTGQPPLVTRALVGPERRREAIPGIGSDRRRVVLPGRPLTWRTFRTVVSGPGSGVPVGWGRFLEWSGLDLLPLAPDLLRGRLSLVGLAPLDLETCTRNRLQCSPLLRVRQGPVGLLNLARLEDDPAAGKAGVMRRLALDGDYVRRRSLGFDLAIVLFTLLSGPPERARSR
ncbi:MAG: sugar transferase [Candidatus Krumholzibacteriia bacterium]